MWFEISVRLLCDDSVVEALGQFIKSAFFLGVFVRLTGLHLFRLKKAKIIVGVDSLSFSTRKKYPRIWLVMETMRVLMIVTTFC